MPQTDAIDDETVENALTLIDEGKASPFAPPTQAVLDFVDAMHRIYPPLSSFELDDDDGRDGSPWSQDIETKNGMAELCCIWDLDQGFLQTLVALAQEHDLWFYDHSAETLYLH